MSYPSTVMHLVEVPDTECCKHSESGRANVFASSEVYMPFKKRFKQTYELDVWGIDASDSNTKVSVKVISRTLYGITVSCNIDVTAHFIAVGT